MKIRFDPKIGEVNDFFSFLYWVYNSDEINKQFEEYELESNEDYESFIRKVKQDEYVQNEKLKSYYSMEIGLADVFLLYSEIWEYPEIDECLNFIKKLDKNTLRFRLIREIIRCGKNGNELEEINNRAKEIAIDEHKSIAFIKDLDYDSGLKWDLFCFLQEPEKYRDDYVSLMQNLIPVFYKYYEPKRKEINAFNKHIEKNFNDKGINFLKQFTGIFFKYEIYEEVFITTSYVNYYSLMFKVLDHSSYIYLGLGFEESIKQYKGGEKDKLKKYVNIFKNFSDTTRFQILKLIVEDEEYCSKDIAEKLGITGATVSYHINNLCSAELVIIDRKDRKNIYTVNKDVIRDGIEFLIKELKL